MLDLLEETWKLRPKLKKNIEIFVEKVNTENTIARSFKAKYWLHYIPEASVNIPGSKPLVLTQSASILVKLVEEGS